MPSGRKESSGTPGRLRQCPTCSGLFDPKGYGSHSKACARHHSQKLQQMAFIQENLEPDSPPPPPSHSIVRDSGPTSDKPWEGYGRIDPDSEGESPPSPSTSDSVSNSDGSDANSNFSTRSAERAPSNGDIKIEYHPNAQHLPQFLSFAEYQASERKARKPQPSHSKRPWKPFKHRAEFEFAEVALGSSLSKKDVNALIRVIKRLKKGEDKFEIDDHEELCTIWDAGTKLHAAPLRHVISVEYKPGDVRKFDFWSSSVWDWAVGQVEDPSLAPHFQWDAKRLYKFDGTKYVRFFTEPSSGNRLWDIQNELPSDGTPLYFIFYADKTKLSSWGTAMGYPVYARIGNLDVNIRNSNGVGGGELVGWLPIVPEDEAEKGRKEYADFKRIVWHQSFLKLLETISRHSATGCWVQCGDGKRRRLFPFILILSGDYEEQCVMGLNRGYQGYQPCPICHVPKEKLHDLRGTWPLCTGVGTQKLIDEARSLDTAHGEELLKANGIRPIDSAFLSVKNSDPHKVLSFDRMHNSSHGLGGKHLFRIVKSYLKATGREALKTLDERFSFIPSWTGLQHFDQVVSIDFTDASKLEDIVKILLFAAHNLIGPKYPEAIALFSALRAYLNVFMYTGFNLHTEETIEFGKEELKRFSDLMIKFKASTTLKKIEDKSWDIPKMHLHTHALPDVTDKGVSRNYNTKIFETLHGPIKEIYHQVGNQKNVDEQIMRMDQWSRVLKSIRSKVDSYDQSLEDVDEDNIEDLNLDTANSKTSITTHGQITLGSVQKRCALKDISAAHTGDPAFTDFSRKFRHFLENTQFSSKISDNERQEILKPNSFILEYRYLKVFFTSKVTWDTQVNHLRCNPMFHGKPRYDFVMVDTSTGPIFARLIFMFTTSTETRTDPWALIQPYDSPVAYPSSYERRLQFYRIRAKIRSSSRFISAKSIIRGVLIIPTYLKDDDYYVFDLLDDDLFMRMRELWRLRLRQ